MADFDTLLDGLSDEDAPPQPQEQDDASGNGSHFDNDDTANNGEMNADQADGQSQRVVTQSDEAQVPSALLEARTRRDNENDQDLQINELAIDADDLEEEGGANHNNLNHDGNNYESNNDDESDDKGPGADKDYEHLKHIWIQELNSTEILPRDAEIMEMLIEDLS